MEVMEINEHLMDAKMEEDEKKINDLQVTIDNFQAKIYEPVKEIAEHYKDRVTTGKKLLQVKEYYHRKKYLQRIRHQSGGK